MATLRLVEGHNAYKGKEVPYTLSRDRDGVPDFKAIDPKRIRKCLEKNLCGICGQRLGSPVVFVGGEESTRFNDPPNHPRCAARAFLSCPFLKGERVREPIEDQHGTYAVDSGNYGVFIATKYEYDPKSLQSWPSGAVRFGKLDRAKLEEMHAAGAEWDDVRPTP